MARTKGAKGITVEQIEKETQKLLKELDKQAPNWDQLLSKAGKNIERIGSMLHGYGRKKPRSWSIKELWSLHLSLHDNRDVLRRYVDHILDEQNELLSRENLPI